MALVTLTVTAVLASGGVPLLPVPAVLLPAGEGLQHRGHVTGPRAVRPAPQVQHVEAGLLIVDCWVRSANFRLQVQTAIAKCVHMTSLEKRS